MLHLLYILVFTVIAFVAIANLVRSLFTLGQESHRPVANMGAQSHSIPESASMATPRRRVIPHPELLDSNGKPVNEPLLVMRSVDVEEAREKLDALYRSSPSVNENEG